MINTWKEREFFFIPPFNIYFFFARHIAGLFFGLTFKKNSVYERIKFSLQQKKNPPDSR
jgi:hypothetical protein